MEESFNFQVDSELQIKLIPVDFESSLSHPPHHRQRFVSLSVSRRLAKVPTIEPWPVERPEIFLPERDFDFDFDFLVVRTCCCC